MLRDFCKGVTSHSAFFDYVLRYSLIRNYSPLNTFVPFASCAGWAIITDGSARKWAVWALLVTNCAADALADVIVVKVHQRRYSSRNGVAPPFGEMFALLRDQGGHLPFVRTPVGAHLVRGIPRDWSGTPEPVDHIFGVPPSVWAASFVVVITASFSSWICWCAAQYEAWGLSYPA